MNRINTQDRVCAAPVAFAALLLLALFAVIMVGQSVQAQDTFVGPPQPVQDRPLSTLRDLNQAFIDISSHVKPAVVTVSTERILSVAGSPFGTPFTQDPFFDFFFGPDRRRQQPEERQYRQQGLGSGIIVDPDGIILTNNHVVADADSIYVQTFDGERYLAEVVGTDPQTDVAVLRVDASGLPSLPIGNSDDLQVGEIVMAIGSPMSANLAHTVTQGIVSATGRSNVGLAEYEDFIQTDAAINPGNSGGPLVNLNGELVGINTAIASRTGGFQGIGFAVPSNMAVGIMNSLLKEGKVTRGWLGVSIQDLNETMASAMGLTSFEGALVGDVVEDSPADKAGLEAGDIILAVDDHEVDGSATLRNRIASTAPDTDVTLTINRNGSIMHVPVRLGELNPEAALASAGRSIDKSLGFSVQTLTDDLARQYEIGRRVAGIIVTSIDPASAAYRAGLREGDLIRSINRHSVQNESEFYGVVDQLEKGASVMLGVYRNGNGFFIAFTL